MSASISVVQLNTLRNEFKSHLGLSTVSRTDFIKYGIS